MRESSPRKAVVTGGGIGKSINHRFHESGSQTGPGDLKEASHLPGHYIPVDLTQSVQENCGRVIIPTGSPDISSSNLELKDTFLRPVGQAIQLKQQTDYN